MKSIILLITIAILSTLVFCSDETITEPDPNKDIATSSIYFPLEDNDTWFYDAGDNKVIKRVIAGDTILRQTSLNPDTCKRVIDSFFFFGTFQDADTEQLWSSDSNNFFLHLVAQILYPQPKLSVPFGLNINEKYYYNSVIYKIIGDSLQEQDQRIIGNITNLGGISKTIP